MIPLRCRAEQNASNNAKRREHARAPDPVRSRGPRAVASKTLGRRLKRRRRHIVASTFIVVSRKNRNAFVLNESFPGRVFKRVTFFLSKLRNVHYCLWFINRQIRRRFYDDNEIKLLRQYTPGDYYYYYRQYRHSRRSRTFRSNWS